MYRYIMSWRAVFMGRKPPLPKQVGRVLVISGVLIVSYLVLPSGFWWFLIGVAMIVAGVCWCKRC